MVGLRETSLYNKVHLMFFKIKSDSSLPGFLMVCFGGSFSGIKIYIMSKDYERCEIVIYVNLEKEKQQMYSRENCVYCELFRSPNSY